ncbi:hypothetical protein Fot_12097 [Forsythia ovata]|uniref:Treslin n=1 Tax=Forsythia ovata TaxID=205694 RepID=A0ABD1WLR2_9LAMI
MAMNQPPLDFSKTQRVVLLIDLHPLLTLQNPTPYLTTILSAVSSFLNFPPLSASLFAYKLFFSSLSPLRSASTLPSHLHTPSLSFNLPSHTLASLSNALSSFPILTHLQNPPGASASFVASSLLQLIHDYSWESENENLLSKHCFNDFNLLRVPSNLVLLFSPICRSINFLSEFMDLHNLDGFSVKFEEIFCGVREAFVTRDIHFSWINVKSDEQQLEAIDEKEVDISECGFELAIFEKGNRKMGWGFCSSDLIVFGSALLPFGLIYPKIGISFDFVDFGGMRKEKRSGQLSLEILDVNGKPLHCKCLDLELVKLKSFLGAIRPDHILNALELRDSQGDEFNQDAVWGQFGDGCLKLQIKAVQRYDDCGEIGGCLSNYVIACECFGESRKGKTKSNGHTFADRVLEMLHGEIGGVTYKNEMPIWQMILSFLYREGYWAIVSLSNDNGDSSVGILKPFTAHLAILSIIDDNHAKINDLSGSNFGQIDDEIRNTCTADMNDSNLCISSQTDTSTSGNCEPSGDRKRKKSKKHLHQDMKWSSFCQAVLEGSQFDLLEVYISGQFEKSKKLKFLRCWMKQIHKVNPHCLRTLSGSKSMEEFSMCHGLSPDLSRAEEGAIPLSNSEISKTFFNNLPRRIQHGLESGMDLQNLAERVVKSCIHFLDRKCEIDNDTKDQPLQKDSGDSCHETFGARLIKLLLKEPKEMKKIHQNDDPLSKASDPCSTSENTVREYEFQILLRMEILRAGVSVNVEQASKQKLVKQICALLEIIQYLMEGGIHGHISLYDYVERTIKARYINTLEDVVQKIYTKMDLLPFGDEDEVPSLLFNSEDSNQPWREKHERYEKSETNSIHQSVSAEDESLQPPKNINESSQLSRKEEREHLFNEARERRERARRFVSFTSQMPDLQRVWAPKQPKAAKAKSVSLPKKSKRKDTQKTTYSVVHETPMTGNKGDRDLRGQGISSNSVSKALFQDN